MKNMLHWITPQPDKKLERRYFQESGKRKSVFYPLGRSGECYSVSDEQKKGFIRIYTFVLISSYIFAAALVYPLEVIKAISIFGLLVIGANLDLFVNWVLPMIYAMNLKASFIPTEKSAGKRQNPEAVKVIFLNTGIQLFSIFLGLFLSPENYFLWGALLFIFFTYPVLIFFAWKGTK